MQRFLLKILGIIGPLLFFVIVYFSLHIFRNLRAGIPIDFISKLKNSEIIICGDSRADRQLDPAIFHFKTKLNTLNMAKGVWDLYTLSKTLLESKVESKIIVISASSWQFNDGAIDNGYFSLESFLGLSFLERIKLYRHHPLNLFLIQNSLLKYSLFNNTSVQNLGPYQRNLNVDFNKQPCSEFKIDKNWFENNPFYKTPNAYIYKRQLLLQALNNLQRLRNCKILIYNGPVSENFIEAANSRIVGIEKQFDEFMTVECKKRKLVYHSFFDDKSIRKKEFYYDPQHLCEFGTTFFSEKVVNLLYSKGLLKHKRQNEVIKQN